MGEETKSAYILRQNTEDIEKLKKLEAENGKSHIRLELGIDAINLMLTAQNVSTATLKKDIQEIKLKPGQNYSKLLWVGLGIIGALLSNILAGLIVKGFIKF